MRSTMAVCAVLAAIMLIGTGALASEQTIVAVSCPATVSHGGSFNAQVVFKNKSTAATVSVTKGVFALHLGGDTSPGPRN